MTIRGKLTGRITGTIKSVTIDGKTYAGDDMMPAWERLAEWLNNPRRYVYPVEQHRGRSTCRPPRAHPRRLARRIARGGR